MGRSCEQLGRRHFQRNNLPAASISRPLCAEHHRVDGRAGLELARELRRDEFFTQPPSLAEIGARPEIGTAEFQIRM